jgi:hypothetical protein
MNRYAPHVYVIPEDDRDRQIADGFVQHYQVKDTRIKVMPPAGGWSKVLGTFQSEYMQTLRDYPEGHVVLLIDFDDDVERRRDKFQEAIPKDLASRVFVVGSKYNPESLKNAMNIGYEEIGSVLASDCDDGITDHWNHEQLQHNDAERERLVQIVRPFLF